MTRYFVIYITANSLFQLFSTILSILIYICFIQSSIHSRKFYEEKQNDETVRHF
jgi:hypothetical protein